MGAIEQDILNAEELVLGAFILEESTARRYVSRVKECYFCEQRRQHIFQIINRLVESGQNLDLFILSTEMEREQMGEANRCALELIHFSEQLASTAHIEDYIEMLRQGSVRRQVRQVGESMLKESWNMTLDPDSLIEKFTEMLRDIQAERPWEKSFRTQQEVAESAFSMRQERLARKGEDGVTGIHTGIGAIDERTSGWQADELIVIGGQNGHGKSWFMIKHLMGAATAGHKCLVYSLEMSIEDLYARELMMASQVTAHDWYKGTSSVDRNLELQRAKEALMKLPITYMDHNEYDIDRLCTMAREEHARGLCDVLFIDYAQIIRASEKQRYDKRLEVVTYFTHRLKELAKELHIPVVVLAQLNRNQIKNTDGRPQKSDLRESGSLEQDADKIWLIWRPALHGVLEYGKGKEDTKNMVVYICAKDRRFGECEVVLHHNGGFTQFS